MSDLNSLTNDLLKLIMQQVPVKDRLTSCCLINSRMHAAAVAATDALTLGPQSWCLALLDKANIPSPEHAQAALEWLALFGQHVTSLEFNAFPQTVQQLPCPKLLELQMEYDCCVQLGPTATPYPGVIPGCTNLTRLDLSCNILDASGGAGLCGSLSRLVHLQHLRVHPRNEQSQHCVIEGFKSGTLPCWQHLTYLHVYNLSVDNILELEALTNLQELWLTAGDGVTVGPRSVPGFMFPSSLTGLSLASPVEAAILLAVPAGLKDLAIFRAVDGPAEGPSSLLAGMAGLQNLTELRLFPREHGNWPPPGPAYSALTASSNLVELAVSGDALPLGVWSFVFPAQRTLPHLTNLKVDFDSSFDDPALPGAWGATDLACLIRPNLCCPNLRKLEVAMQHGPHVSELHKLTALTEVELHYSPSEGSALQATMQGLAAVTQLQSLDVNLHCCVVSMAVLLPLTKLKGLSRLSFGCNTFQDDSEDGEIEYPDHELHLNQKDSGPAVWVQLLERCAAEPDCPPEAKHSLAQQVTEQQALIQLQQQQLADLQEQLAAQQQQNSDQQDQLAAQQLEIAELRQQLSAQQQVAAEQGDQVAGLQGQLQSQLQDPCNSSEL